MGGRNTKWLSLFERPLTRQAATPPSFPLAVKMETDGVLEEGKKRGLVFLPSVSRELKYYVFFHLFFSLCFLFLCVSFLLYLLAGNELVNIILLLFINFRVFITN